MIGNWIWDTIDLGEEVSRGYGANRTRANWTLVRHRTIDEAYTSQQGETASNLTAKRGTVDFQVDAPTLTDLIAFTDIDSANWCTSSQVWIPSGQIANGAPVYVPRGTNIPNAYAINALMRVKIVDSVTSTDGEKVSYLWRVSEVSPNDLADIASVDTIQATTAGYSYSAIITSGSLLVRRYPYSNFAGVESESYSPVGLVIGDGSDLSGSFTGSATVATTSAQMELTCESDAMEPDNQGTTWWNQVQTWTYVEPWT